MTLNRTLYISDNLAVLRRLPTGSVDLICTDPPFATNQTFVGKLKPELTADEKERERATLIRMEHR